MRVAVKFRLLLSDIRSI